MLISLCISQKEHYFKGCMCENAKFSLVFDIHFTHKLTSMKIKKEELTKDIWGASQATNSEKLVVTNKWKMYLMRLPRTSQTHLSDCNTQSEFIISWGKICSYVSTEWFIPFIIKQDVSLTSHLRSLCFNQKYHYNFWHEHTDGIWFGLTSLPSDNNLWRTSYTLWWFS